MSSVKIFYNPFFEKKNSNLLLSGHSSQPEPQDLIFTTPVDLFNVINNELSNNPTATHVKTFISLVQTLLSSQPVPAPPNPLPADYQKRQSRPIYLGVSGGSIRDLNVSGLSSSCCGGTLGCCLYDIVNNKQYILGNKHVFAQDITNSAIGDSIRQPGLIDNNCANTATDEVAKLAKWSPIAFKTSTTAPLNLIDASIAEVVSGKVRLDGAILGIGTVSSVISPSVGTKVMKAGRTTGLTKGSITGINSVIDVSYSDKCAGTATYTARFSNQFVISPDTDKFSDAGDSGSLIVTNQASPSAVGLLFAGSSGLTFANRMTDVLTYFNLKISSTSSLTTSESSHDLTKTIQTHTLHSDFLFLKYPHIIGHYIGQKNNEWCVYVFTTKSQTEIQDSVLSEIEGIKVYHHYLTEPIRAF